MNIILASRMMGGLLLSIALILSLIGCGGSNMTIINPSPTPPISSAIGYVPISDTLFIGDVITGDWAINSGDNNNKIIIPHGKLPDFSSLLVVGGGLADYISVHSNIKRIVIWVGDYDVLGDPKCGGRGASGEVEGDFVNQYAGIILEGERLGLQVAVGTVAGNILQGGDCNELIGELNGLITNAGQGGLRGRYGIEVIDFYGLLNGGQGDWDMGRYEDGVLIPSLVGYGKITKGYLGVNR